MKVYFLRNWLVASNSNFLINISGLKSRGTLLPPRCIIIFIIIKRNFCGYSGPLENHTHQYFHSRYVNIVQPRLFENRCSIIEPWMKAHQVALSCLHNHRLWIILSINSRIDRKKCSQSNPLTCWLLIQNMFLEKMINILILHA